MPAELLNISAARKPESKKQEFQQRRFEDGSVEVQLSNGARLRQIPSTCSSCGTQKIDGPWGRDPPLAARKCLCVGCYSKEMAARQEAAEQEWLERMSRGETGSDRRRFAQTLATPANGATVKKIREIYACGRNFLR